LDFPQVKSLELLNSQVATLILFFIFKTMAFTAKNEYKKLTLKNIRHLIESH